MGQRAPTPEYPIADAMLQVMVPGQDGDDLQRRPYQLHYAPACPYGEIITLRIASYRRPGAISKGEVFSVLCERRLPPVKRPDFSAINLPVGNGVLSPQAANYLLSVMVHGMLIISGATGSGKHSSPKRSFRKC